MFGTHGVLNTTFVASIVASSTHQRAYPHGYQQHKKQFIGTAFTLGKSSPAIHHTLAKATPPITQRRKPLLRSPHTTSLRASTIDLSPHRTQILHLNIQLLTLHTATKRRHKTQCGLTLRLANGYGARATIGKLYARRLVAVLNRKRHRVGQPALPTHHHKVTLRGTPLIGRKNNFTLVGTHVIRDIYRSTPTRSNSVPLRPLCQSDSPKVTKTDKQNLSTPQNTPTHHPFLSMAGHTIFLLEFFVL